jgi:hypothetical protein
MLRHINLSTCPTCNTNFVPKSKNHAYCKPTCTPSYRNRELNKAARVLRAATLEEIQCATCGEFFKPRQINHKYCCSMCRPVKQYIPFEFYSQEHDTATPPGYIHPDVRKVLNKRHAIYGGTAKWMP